MRQECGIRNKPTNPVAKFAILISSLFVVTAPLRLAAQDGAPMAEPRHALVIGNSAYGEFGSLKNPVNDATDMAAALRRLGFTVNLLTDAELPRMEEAAIKLSEALKQDPSSIGLFYFAGHGVQSNGENYLIPINTTISAEAFLRQKTLSAQAALDLMQGSGNRLNLIFLDACRDFPSSWSRSASRGLSVVSRQPPGSIIVYATSAGNVAQDGKARNGTFTGELLRFIETPDLDLNGIIDRTAESVLSVTGNRQHPAVYKQFFGTVYLKKSVGSTVPAPGVASQPPAIVKEYGFINFSGIISECRIFIDNEYMGSSPLNEMRIPAGPTSIRFVYPGKGEFTQSVTVVPNSTIYIRSGDNEANPVFPMKRTIRISTASAGNDWAGIKPVWIKNQEWSYLDEKNEYNFSDVSICIDDKKLYWKVTFPEQNPFKKTPKGIKTMLCMELTILTHYPAQNNISLQIKNHVKQGVIETAFGTWNMVSYSTISNSAIATVIRDNAVEGSISLVTLRKYIPSGVYPALIQLYELNEAYQYSTSAQSTDVRFIDLK